MEMCVWIIIIIIIKSFYSLWSIRLPWRGSRYCDLQLFPWPLSMIFLFLVFHSLLSFATFSSAYIFLYIPEDSNLMLFSLLLLLLRVMYNQTNSIFFFLSDFLSASVGRFSMRVNYGWTKWGKCEKHFTLQGNPRRWNVNALKGQH